MIAPIKQPQEHSPHLTGARRAVAAAFFRGPSAEAARHAPPVSRRAAWLFVAWAAVVACAYFFRGPR
jgi:hypothetical protein